MGMCDCLVRGTEIYRSYLGKGSMELRPRTGYTSSGTGIHGGVKSLAFNSTFWNQCSSWASNTNHYTVYYYDKESQRIDWFGQVGTLRSCGSGSCSWHWQARAFDLTRVQFHSGGYSDMNWSWRGARSIGHRRRYLGVVANLRRHFGTVLSAWYNSAHHNHIHFDNGTKVGPIKKNWKSDTTLIQASCRYLNNESLAIDGVWGSKTDAAYHRLLQKFCMDGGNYSPRYNTSDALLLLEFIVKCAFANKPAGYYFCMGG